MPEITFHYIKAADYREVPAHGAFGGLAPTGAGIYLAVYSERPPVPTATFHHIDEAGVLGDEDMAKRQSKQGVVRMLQFGMHMSIDQARGIRDWLNVKLSEYEKLVENGKPTDS